ncbi:hypothetical protein BDV97DRAFT_345970 [Delphinella strobiligena]|nr:hypothetical protein BDV97DRAFT_345970 [Delphinella strobiligena]
MVIIISYYLSPSPFCFIFFYKNLVSIGQYTNTRLNMLSFYLIALPVMATLLYNTRKPRPAVPAPDSQSSPTPSPFQTLANPSSTAPCSLKRDCGGQGGGGQRAREERQKEREILLPTLPTEWALFPLRPPGKRVVGVREPE